MYIYMCVSVCVNVCVNVCVSECTHTHIYMCVCVCVCRERERNTYSLGVRYVLSIISGLSLVIILNTSVRPREQFTRECFFQERRRTFLDFAVCNMYELQDI